MGVKGVVAWTVCDAVGEIPLVAVMVGVPLATTDVPVRLNVGVIVPVDCRADRPTGCHCGCLSWAGLLKECLILRFRRLFLSSKGVLEKSASRVGTLHA